MVNATFNVVATTSDKVKDLIIKNGQLIFVRDKGRVAFDFKDKRVFYNQITELDTEQERETLSAPVNGYYFVIETAVLWFYGDEWVQITTPPRDVVFIGVELPELGQAKTGTLYVNKAEKEISVWDEESNEYVVVADKTEDTGSVSFEDINSLFVGELI